MVNGLRFGGLGLEFRRKFGCFIFEHKIKAVIGIFWVCGLLFMVYGLEVGVYSLGFTFQGLGRNLGVRSLNTKLK